MLGPASGGTPVVAGPGVTSGVHSRSKSYRPVRPVWSMTRRLTAGNLERTVARSDRTVPRDEIRPTPVIEMHKIGPLLGSEGGCGQGGASGLGPGLLASQHSP